MSEPLKRRDGGARRRQTHRKRMIARLLESSYRETPVLIDELRHAVRIAELKEGRDAETSCSRSWMNSFARTIREQFPAIRREKISIGPATFVGLVARAALYRLPDPDGIRRLLESPELCILCRYIRNQNVPDPRYEKRSVTPHHHAATFRFFSHRPQQITYDELKGAPGTFIPATHKLTVLCSPGTALDMRSIATVPWKLFGYRDLDDWFEVGVLGGLEAVSRNTRR